MTWTKALFVSVLYTLAIIGLFNLLLRSDPFAIFDFGYVFMAVPGIPICATVILWYYDRVSDAPDWKPTLATTAVFLVVSFLNLAVIAAASASI